MALRAGHWDEARRLILAQKDLPPGLKPKIGPFIEALADPAKRPAVVAELQQLDPKIAKQSDLLMPYLELKQYDIAFDVMNKSLDKDRLAWAHSWDIMHVWAPESAAFRRDPRFAQFVQRIGLVDYWKQYGYPDGCRAGSDAPIVCS